MRRTISILLAALVAFGCAKEELAVLEPSGTTEASGSVGMSPINFAFSKGAENLGTKAASIDDVLPEDATLNVFADVYLTPAGGTKTLYVQNYLNGVKYDNDGNPVSGKYYWPESDDNVALDFYFVYPYKEDRTISNKSFEYTIDSDPSKQEDLLVASSLNTAFPSSTDGRVSVVMDHALSILDFKVKAEESGYEYKVEGITVNNAAGFYDKGTYTFGSGWGSLSKVNSVNSISSPINVATVSSSEYTDVNDGDYCFVLPQDVASMGINVRYSVFKNGTTYTDTKSVSLTDKTFAAGKKYTYNVTLPKLPAVQLIPLSTPFVWTSSISKTELEFTWTCDDESLVGGYDLYWSTSGEPTISGSPNATTTSKTYKVYVGTNKTTCYFAVVAKPKAGDEEHEASDAGRTSATTSNKALAPPTIRVSDIGPDYIEFTWNAVDNADIYIIKDNSTDKVLDTINGTTFKWTRLNGGTKYTISIVAKKTNNSYDPSPEAYKSATTLLLADWWGSINANIQLSVNENEYATEYGILMNVAKGLKITYKFTNEVVASPLALRDGYYNLLPGAEIVNPGDTEEHTAYINITDEFKNMISNHNKIMVIDIPWNAYISKIEYAY